MYQKIKLDFFYHYILAILNTISYHQAFITILLLSW